MTAATIFIQIQARPGLIEGVLNEKPVFSDVLDLLTKAGVEIDENTFIFIDDTDQPHSRDHGHPIAGLKHGSRIHVTRCKRVKTTIHFLEQAAEHEFSPGTRVRAVKEWAVHYFKMNPKDAAEHVLQICKSTTRPASDTPLHELIEGHGCSVCFDLVPEKRVEG